MTRRAYRAYLFDLDGTLVDTAPDLMRALNHALAQGGFEAVGEALTRHWVGHGVKAMLRAAFEYHGARWTETALGDLEAACLDHYAAHLADHSRPYPGVADALPLLAARGGLAVVTNKSEDLSARLLAALGLERLLPVVFGRDTCARPKPAADPALAACARLGVAPEDALFVGDSETDVLCARAAGCDVAAVRYGYSHGIAPEDLGADRVIDSLRDLI